MKKPAVTEQVYRAVLFDLIERLIPTNKNIVLELIHVLQYDLEYSNKEFLSVMHEITSEFPEIIGIE